MPKARVLAVDDQRYFRELIEGLLVDEGYEVRTASSGEEALHVLERESFEIVVTDLVMPGIDGSQLVERIKQCNPEQEIVMVTGVVDVKTAVEAMKRGATDYILKPFDRGILSDALERILQRRRLREEHSRLMAENLEFMGVLSLYERVTGLYSTLAVDALAERLIEGLCLETRAQSGVLWMVEDVEGEALALRSARGIIRVDEESVVLELSHFERAELAALDAGRSAIRTAAPELGQPETLWVPVRSAGALLAVARLSDRLDAEGFDTRDLAGAEKFAGLAGAAVANALRFHALERRSFRDPTTRAYTAAYFEDAVRNEIRKSSRFGRRFSLIQIQFDGSAQLRRALPETDFDAFLADLVQCIGGALRSTDLLATRDASTQLALLPETDALGAAALKQRIREAVAGADFSQRLAGRPLPKLALASVSYPSDGSQLDLLSDRLAARVESARENAVNGLPASEQPFTAVLEKLLESAERHPRDAPAAIARFLLDDLARRPAEHGLLLASADASLGPILREALERLSVLDSATEFVLVGRPEAAPQAGAADRGGPDVTWIEPRALDAARPFLLYYGEGPAYAMSMEPDPGADGVRFFHTSDRGLVEQLVFRLQRDLGIPMSA